MVIMVIMANRHIIGTIQYGNNGMYIIYGFDNSRIMG